VYVWPKRPFEIEQGCAEIISEQEVTGFTFNRPAAVRLAQELRNAQADIEAQLVEHFGSWWAAKDNQTSGHTPTKDRKVKLSQFPDVTIPRFGKNGKALKPYVGPPMEHYTAGAPYVRIERVTFSPSSRDHLGQRLKEVYGWKPAKFGKDGKPTVDEDTIKSIPESVLPADLRKLLLDYFTITKTLGQLSTGRKSWLASVGEDGKIHGRMNTCGAITGRGIHYDPNVGQVPKVLKDKQGNILKGLAGGFGWESRGLFGPSAGWELTGTDASSLELLCLGHYLAPHDEGTFSARVSDPERDPHTEHAEITGLNRDDTKTVTYASLYGGGAGRISEELEVTEDEIPDLLAYKPLPNMIAWLRRIGGTDFVEPDDKQKALLAKAHIVLKKFEQGIPGWKDLKEGVAQAAKLRGWLKGLDGRKLYVRKAHAALNTLLQAAGAIICKLWMILVRKKLTERGLKPGADFRQVAWIHDELQIEHRKGLGPMIGEVSREAIREAGEMLGFRAVLRSDFKTGLTWAETH
jgi:DNA polymerase I-like protein with 3'-5' exonuclease and polymerase domains